MGFDFVMYDNKIVKALVETDRIMGEIDDVGFWLFIIIMSSYR